MGIRAGELRHRIDIQENQGETRDTEGEPVPDWVTVEASIPAAQDLAGGSESLDTNVQHATASVVMRVRYRASRAFAANGTRRPAMRFLWDGRTYDIQEISPDPKREVQFIRGVARDV